MKNINYMCLYFELQKYFIHSMKSYKTHKKNFPYSANDCIIDKYYSL